MNLSVLQERALANLDVVRSILSKDSSEAAIDLAGFNLHQYIEKCLKLYQLDKESYFKSSNELNIEYVTALFLGAPKCGKFENILKTVDSWEIAYRCGNGYVVTRLLLEKYTRIAIDYLSKILELDFDNMSSTPVVKKSKEVEITKEDTSNWVDINYENVPPSQRSLYGTNEATVAVNFYRSKSLRNARMLNEKESLDFIIKLLRLLK